MPRFTDQKPPPSLDRASQERLSPRDKPRAEPAGLDAFVAQAAVTAPPELAAAAASRGRGRALPASPMPVRFPPDVKAALERLSHHDRRSQQQILELVAFPAILAAARQLGS